MISPDSCRALSRERFTWAHESIRTARAWLERGDLYYACTMFLLAETWRSAAKMWLEQAIELERGSLR